jgi:hypothetical protein
LTAELSQLVLIGDIARMTAPAAKGAVLVTELSASRVYNNGLSSNRLIARRRVFNAIFDVSSADYDAQVDHDES